MTKLSPVRKCETWVLVVRAMYTAGDDKRAALDEIHRRMSWLGREQQVVAGFPTQADYDADYHDWFANRREG